MRLNYRFIAILITIIAIMIPVNGFAQSDHEAGDLDDVFNSFKQVYEKESRLFRLAQTDEPKINERRIIIKTVNETSFDADQFGVRLVDEIYDDENNRVPHLYVVQVSTDDDYLEKLNEIKASRHVLYAEPDVVIDTSFLVNDPLVREQWYLNAIDMTRAWEVTRGSSDITIALLDSGVNRNHPDLKGRILTGYDFVNDKKGTVDDNGHGTHIAGIIAANINGIGMAGLDHHVNILPVKIFHEKGTGTLADALKGIYYAIEQNVDVINMSYVVDHKSKLEREAILKAHENGIVLVASAGNDGLVKEVFPAAYPEVISVAATNKNDKRAPFSNYGKWIDLSAPGDKIYSTHFVNGYRVASGTSFATPIVSSIASLIKSKHKDWESHEIKWAIEHGAELVHAKNKEWDGNLGFGRLNAYQALIAQLPDKKNDISNTSRHAHLLSGGVHVQEYLQLPLDVDWYMLQLKNKSKININLTDIPKHIDMVAVLYKHDGKKIEEVSVIDNGEMGENESIARNLQSGTYYLAVFDYHGRWSEQPYKIKYKSTPFEFSDVKEYKKEIQYLVDKQIILGISDDAFGPEKPVTRLQAVNMVLREMGIDVQDESVQIKSPGFKDMKPADQGFKEVAKAVELGFIKGKANNIFDPHGHLTRGQMASILVKAYELKGTYRGQFKDVPEGHWAYQFVSPLAANQITTGYGDHTYRPEQTISRQHFALMLYRIIQNKEGIK